MRGIPITLTFVPRAFLDAKEGSHRAQRWTCLPSTSGRTWFSVVNHFFVVSGELALDMDW